MCANSSTHTHLLLDAKQERMVGFQNFWMENHGVSPSGGISTCLASKGAHTVFCHGRSTWVEIIEPLHGGIYVAPVHLPTSPPQLCSGTRHFSHLCQPATTGR